MERDITAYIRELLFRHDCVIIPGFGAFICNYFSASIDREEGYFQPPARRVTFNRHLTGNDGLLIGHISSREEMAYGEAREGVSAWTDDLRRRIMGGQRVTMEHLGVFYTNREGSLFFEPDSSANYLLSSYGLTAFHRKPVSDFDVRQRVLGSQYKEITGEPSVRKLLTRAAVIIPVLVALALVPFNDHLFKSRVDETNLNPLAKAELEYNRQQINAGSEITVPELKADEITVTKPVEKINREPQQEITPEQVSKAVIVTESKYLVIIGSFRTEDNALVMMEKLRKDGYNPEIAGGPDGFLRVSASSYPTLEEAEAALLRLKKNYTGSWILRSGR